VDYGEFDFKNPDYTPILKARIEALARIRAAVEEERREGRPPSVLPALRAYYRANPVEFVNDWGMTFDPRNPTQRNLPALVPFVLFKRQREFLEWLHDHWRNARSGISDKSREVGESWLTIAFAVTVSIFNDGLSIGFGSRLADYVDKIGEPKSIFVKGRIFARNLPPEFRGGWEEARDAPYMQMRFPETGSMIGGEVGDNIGRGDRRSFYIVDESAHLEHPLLVDFSLSMTTNCRIDISSVNGRANPFAEKRFSYPPEDVFTFHWRDDPRKDDAWYEAAKARIKNPVVVAQEIDIDYSASVEGVLIPSPWVQAAIDAHLKLGFRPTGVKLGALDVADEGIDLNAFCGATGVVVEHVEDWSGKGDDIFSTVQRAFFICDVRGYKEFRYDGDGLGAGVRGDARVINERRKGREIEVTAFRGSGEIVDPLAEDIEGVPNEDAFANAKAQSAWALRTRFQTTFRAVTDPTFKDWDQDELISISSSIPVLSQLTVELSQPTYSKNGAGKYLIDKKPNGARSPNLYDAVMIRFAKVKKGMKVTKEFSTELARLTARRR